MIEINLIPDVKQDLIKAQRMRTMVITSSIFASIIAAGAVVLLLVYIFGVQLVRTNIVDGQIKDGAADLAKVEDLSKILTIQNQLAQVSTLNSEKNINSRVFDMLSAVTPAGDNSVQFSQISVDDEETTIRLEGQTRGYDSMEVFKKTVSSAVINYTKEGESEAQTVSLASNVSASDVSFGEDASGKKVLRFVLTYTYAPELFSPEVKTISFKLSLNGNVTDSYLGIPKSLFNERAKDIE